jgi:hypothetical protein
MHPPDNEIGNARLVDWAGANESAGSLRHDNGEHDATRIDGRDAGSALRLEPCLRTSWRDEPLARAFATGDDVSAWHRSWFACRAHRHPPGATELASPGLSPAAPGTSPLGPTTGSMTPCSGIGGSMPQTSDGMGSLSAGTASGMGTSTAGISGSTAVFDGGGIAGTASSGCPANGSNSLAGPAASASSPTGMGSLSSAGRVGIPLGSTELGAGGLSPTPGSLTPNPSAPLSTSGSTAPCQTTGMSTTSGSC